MAEVIMPKVGDAMTEGKVVRWYKKAGEAVKKGEPLLEIETDKVNLDVEAEQDGTLAAVTVEAGQTVPVGNVLASILAPGEKAPAAAKVAGTPKKPEVSEPEKGLQRRTTDKKDSIKHTTGEYQEAIEQQGLRKDRAVAPSANVVAMPEGGRHRSSPLARRMARDLGVPLEAVQGSGPQGRVIAKDVQNFRGATGAQPGAAASRASHWPLR